TLNFFFVTIVLSPCVSFPVEIGGILECRRRRGYCSFGRCIPPAIPIGRCTGQTICCRG
uniref:Beta-defensin-like domain-containing protein n=1 Tax=Ficedula albicollis TaxID=59894 RepID=A0A803VBX6_FICAL